MDTGVEDSIGRAEEAFQAGDYDTSHRLAVEVLKRDPDDRRALTLAARSSAELDLDDASTLLARLVEVEPADAQAWRELGLALASRGDPGAERALREALRLDDRDVAARVALAHVAFGAGDVDEAVAQLDQASSQAPDDPAPLRSLVDMCRMAGRSTQAVAAVRTLLDRRPDDVLALIDLADLHVELDEPDEAAEAFRRLAEVDTEPGHAVYAHHGLIELEIRREGWRRALDHAITASSADRHQLTTDVLAFVTARLFGDSDRPAPAREDLERQLAERRAEHRRMHVEALLP